MGLLDLIFGSPKPTQANESTTHPGSFWWQPPPAEAPLDPSDSANDNFFDGFL
jgi:hypothetical protein